MDAQVYKGGSPVIKYGRDANDPTLFAPPYGRHKHEDTSPPFNAHYDGGSPVLTYAAGCPLKPRELEWQRVNLGYANLGVGDTIQMILVPTNYWIDMVRFDVNNPDALMAGAAVNIVGQRITVDPGDPYNRFLAPVDEPVFAAAAAAQGIGPIPLDVPSSTVLWLGQLDSVTVTGDIPAGTDGGGGVLNNGAAVGFVRPLYVEPEFYPDAAGTVQRFETGGLLLGIRIVTMPNNAVRLEQALFDFYLTTRVHSVSSPSFT
jgi:hypothetical protein